MTRAFVVALMLGLIVFVIVSRRWSTPAPGLVRYAPPPIYATWWSKVEACSGLTAPMSRAVVSWWRTPHDEIPTSSGQLDDGVFFQHDREIALRSSHTLNEEVVRHEMLHALLAAHGIIGGHPPEYFVTRCHLTADSWGTP